MSSPSRKSKVQNVERRVLSELQNNETPLDNDELLTKLQDTTDEELRSAISNLLDQHRIKLTPEWEYDVSDE